MSTAYLIRHGQAGTRNDYDTLSDLGRRQAELLGQYFGARRTSFDAIYCGELRRQQLTEQIARAASGVDWPPVIVDPRWNEFDLVHVYSAFARHLCEDDPEFRRDYEDMMASYEDPGAPFHRNSTKCDIKVVRAWIQAKYPYDGESWQAFQSRVLDALSSLRNHPPEHSVAVFTSATPTAIAVASILGMADARSTRLAGVSRNSSITTVLVRPDDFYLVTFNATPHLADPAMETHR